MNPNSAQGDKSPMLSRSTQGDELSPMISRIIRQVRVDARGAYLAGNLRALLARLGDDQRAQFRIAIARQAIWHVLQVVESAGEPAVATRCLELAEYWLEAPSRERGEAVLHEIIAQGLVIYIPPHNPYFDLGTFTSQHTSAWVLMALARCLLADLDDQAAAQAVQVAFHSALKLQSTTPISRPHVLNTESARWAAHRWQLDAAWAIWQSQPLPDLDHFIPGDVRGAYRSGNLRALLAQMSHLQRLRFQQAVVRQILFFAEMLPRLRDGVPHVDLAPIRRWLDSPTASHQEALRNALPSPMPDPIHAYAALISGAAAAAIAADATRAAETVTRTLREVGGRSERDAMDRMDEVRWWQIEAAWAILHDEDAPLLAA